MPTFNLLDEPWIPCTERAGATPHLLSLRDLFAHAPHLANIADPSPAVTISLHRLLLAILHRSLGGPRSVAAWQAVWGHNRWDLDRIYGYLDRWHDRFDLLDPQRPFYQTPALDMRAAKPITQLTQERASDRNRALLFDHTPANATLLPAEAARYLIAMHGFAVGGLISLGTGEPLANKYASAAPLLGGAVVLVRGDTLFQTLMLNWVRYNRDDDVPFSFGDDDKPAWERDDSAQPLARLPDGLVDLLTWQSRRILLIPDSSADGATLVRDAILMKGYQFAEGFEQWSAEPMLAFRINKNARNRPAVLPIRLDADRVVWRDSHALFQSVADEQHRPKVMDWLDSLIEGRALNEHAIVPLDVYGLIPEQANIRDWRRESLPLPLRLLEERQAVTQQLLERLRQAISLAEDVGRCFDVGWVPVGSRDKRLPSPMWTLSEALLVGLSDRQPTPDDCRALARSFGVGVRYWSQLDAPFGDFLRQLVEPSDIVEEGGTTRYGVRALRAWASEVERGARAVFGALLNDLNDSSREMHASALADQRFHYLLSALLAPYQPEPVSVPPSQPPQSH